jgi:hypothetical protein
MVNNLYTARFYLPMGFWSNNPVCSIFNFSGQSPSAVYLHNLRIIECRNIQKNLTNNVT